MPDIYFLIRPHWQRLNREIWNSLEKSKSAPQDMYVELLRLVFQQFHVNPNVSAPQMATLNDPDLARSVFRKFPIPPDESSCIEFLEGFYVVLKAFGRNISEKYRLKLSQFLEEHNFRYRLAAECKIELTLQGLLMSQFSHLCKSIASRSERIECLRELQTSLTRLLDTDGEKTCIRIASNLLEGLAIDRSGHRARTLGPALDNCPDLFPHNSLKDCVKNLYEFFSDYPNIRHSGTPANRLRDLNKDDALLMIALSLGLSSFMSSSNATQQILGGNL
ncbi:MAG: hypothetical protein WED05_10135 [Candidatus Atabeyarchaeum deiterrae]